MTPAVSRNSSHETDYATLDRIRQKFQLVFGSRCMLGDDILIKRYRISSEGDLIMIIS